MASGDSILDEKINDWLKWDRSPDTLNEIQKLIDEKNWDSLRCRLLNRIKFGTAGLRGEMRMGFDSMNELVIVQTAQGFCKYVMEQFPDEKYRLERGIVLGYDGRHKSKLFAELTATVFIQNGIPVWLYSEMVATPFVPAAILELKCLAGVMVTASHNPKQDNGYKVYWQNGAQIIQPHDVGIERSILANLEPLDSSWNTKILNSNPLLKDPLERMLRVYYEKMQNFIPKKFLDINKTCELKCVYTAMHGVGYKFIERGFEISCLQPVIPVQQQKDPDPEFPTVKLPNPEEGKGALDLSIMTATERNVSLILANDPDADRLACAEKDAKTGEWKIFTGNELGALLGWWSIVLYRNSFPEDDMSGCYMLSSAVSSKILHSMSKLEGFNHEETLTGFKHMGNRCTELFHENQKNKVLFAFEEAIGFMISTNVLDKDGISAACHLATMASYLKEKGLTLCDQLNEIYRIYGYHCSKNSYFICHDDKIKNKIFQRLRTWSNGEMNTYPTKAGNYLICGHKDYSSQMISFNFENGLAFTIRSSGTEPKIKYYSELQGKPGNDNWKEMRDTLEATVKIAVEEFLQPSINNLQVKIE